MLALGCMNSKIKILNLVIRITIILNCYQIQFLVVFLVFYASKDTKFN